jgi:hypothetical protein
LALDDRRVNRKKQFGFIANLWQLLSLTVEETATRVLGNPGDAIYRWPVGANGEQQLIVANSGTILLMGLVIMFLTLPSRHGG